MLSSVTPFSIVDDLTATIQFYQSRLGFQVIDVLLPGCQQRLERAHVNLEFTACRCWY